MYKSIQGSWYFARSRSHKFQVNLQNPAKFTKTHEIPRNSLEIFPNTCRHNLFESYLGCWGCLLDVNLLIYLETSSPQRVNNIPKLPGVLWYECCKKLGSNDVKTQALQVKTMETGDGSARACFIMLAFREECCVLWRITPYTFISATKMTIFFSERFNPRMIMPENLQNEQSSCSLSQDNK